MMVKHLNRRHRKTANISSHSTHSGGRFFNIALNSLDSSFASPRCAQGHVRSNSLPSSLCKMICLFLIICYLPSLVTCFKVLPEQPVDKVINESVVFDCDAETEDIKGKKLEWLKDGRRIELDSRMQVQGNGQQLQFLVYTVQKSDSGTYECHLTDERTEQVLNKKEVSMHVFEPTNFVGQLTRSAKEGHSVELPCTVTHDPEFKVTSIAWKRHSTNLENSQSTWHKYKIEKDPNAPHKSVLKIKDLDKSDAGYYTCQVIVGNTLKRDVKIYNLKLEVQYEPSWTSNTTNSSYIDEQKFIRKEDKSARLFCHVDANPTAHITWEIVPDGPILNETDLYRSEVRSGHNWSELKIYYKPKSEKLARQRSRPGKEKWGVTPNEFKCIATNSMGLRTKKMVVKIGKLPKMPEILDHSEENNVLTVTIKSQNATPEIDKYGVQIAGHLIEFDSAPESNGTYIVLIQNVPGGEHTFRLLAHNGVGWSEPLHTEAMKLSISGSFIISSEIRLLVVTLIFSLLFL